MAMVAFPEVSFGGLTEHDSLSSICQKSTKVKISAQEIHRWALVFRSVITDSGGRGACGMLGAGRHSWRSVRGGADGFLALMLLGMLVPVFPMATVSLPLRRPAHVEQQPSGGDDR